MYGTIRFEKRTKQSLRRYFTMKYHTISNPNNHQNHIFLSLKNALSLSLSLLREYTRHT